MNQQLAPIGFVGLGNIGLPASTALLRAGHEVIGYDLKSSAAFEAVGGRQANALDEIARCPLIFQSLPGVEALRATVDGLSPHLAPGTIVMDISSYPLAAKQAAREQLLERGVTMLDGEISGLPFQVANHTAVLFCAGPREAVDACLGVFEVIAAKAFYLGEFGAATKLKLIANYMVCAHNLIAAEAINLAGAAGLDLAQVVEVLKPSAAGSTTFANKSGLMLSREFDGGKGPFSHMFGYLDRATELARDAGVAGGVPVLDRVREVYGVARDQGRHAQDIAAIIEVVEAMGREDAA